MNIKKEKTQTSRTLYYFWQATKKHLGLFILAIFVSLGFSGLLTYANPYVMSLIVDRVAAGGVGASQVFDVFGPYIIALVLVNLFGQACSKIQDLAFLKLQIAANYDLATMAFDALSNQSMTFHTDRLGGTLVSQTSKFLNAYSLFMQSIAFPFLPIFVSIVATCILLLPVVPLYTIILYVLLVVYACVSYIMYKRILHLNEKAAGAQNKLSGELADAVTNILAVKTYGREDYEKKLFDQANREVVKNDSARMRATVMRGVFTSAVAIIIMSIVAVFISGANAWYGITPGTLILMFSYTYTLTNQFNFINAGLQRVNQALGDASAMTAILDEPRLVDDVPNAQELVVKDGSIAFEDISFCYNENTSHPTVVFDHFNLIIPGGQRLGLVGVSGSGKSTLTKLLLRLVDIQVGSILIDGQNIANVTQNSLRRNIAYVPQEPLLFHRSIAENIAYGKPDATIEEIEQAARDANADEFIKALPEGYDTLVGERGVKLSGGQRQRISIARAMLANAPILVLDEATSALDSESEGAVQDALLRLMNGRTTIVVAHRLSTVSNLDRIIVIEDGKIIEDGKHVELIDSEGRYASLWDMQTGAFSDQSKTS